MIMLRIEEELGGVAAIGFLPPWSTALLALALIVWTVLTGGCKAAGEPGATDDGVPPMVEAFSPGDGAANVGRGVAIVVTFSEPMDAPSAEAAFSVWPAVAGALLWDETGTVLTLSPDALLPDDREVAVTVTRAARGRSGLPLAAEAGALFVTEQDVAPWVEATSPESGEDTVAVNLPVRIDFSEAMDPVATAAAIQFTPAVAGAWAFSLGGTRAVFTPDTGFAPFTGYGVTVGTGAADLTGSTPATPFTFYFTTDDHLLP